jgi:hypothetical protein
MEKNWERSAKVIGHRQVIGGDEPVNPKHFEFNFI